MKLNFRHGIVRQGTSYIVPTLSGINLSIANNSPLEVAIAYKSTNYFHVESKTVLNAWSLTAGDVAGNPAWLYIDLDPATAVRTFGYTRMDMIVSSSAPGSPANDQHWFDTSKKVLKVYTSATSKWNEKNRILIAKYLNGTIYYYSSSGASQVGITTGSYGYLTGRIVYDSSGKAVKLNDGTFFTTDTDFFVSGNIAQSVRLESDVVYATAEEPIPAYSVVVYSDYGAGGGSTIRLAEYDDVDTSVLAMTTYALDAGDVGTVVTTGNVINMSWDWEAANIPIGAKLYVGIDAEIGTLVAVDPVVASPILERKAHVARVIGKNEIQFSHNYSLRIGSVINAPAAENIPAAAENVLGLVTLYENNATDPANPEVVTIETLANAINGITIDVDANEVTVAPIFDYTFSPPLSVYPEIDLQTILQALYSDKLSISGGTVTGEVIFEGPVTFNNSISVESPNGLNTIEVTNAEIGITTTVSPINITSTTGIISITTEGDIDITSSDNDVNISAPNGEVLVDKDPTTDLGVATKQYVDDRVSLAILQYTPTTTPSDLISPLLFELNSDMPPPLALTTNGYPILTNGDRSVTFDLTDSVTEVFTGSLQQHNFRTTQKAVHFTINADDFKNDVGIDVTYALFAYETATVDTLQLLSLTFDGSGDTVLTIDPLSSPSSITTTLTNTDVISVGMFASSMVVGEIDVELYINGVLVLSHSYTGVSTTITDTNVDKGVYWLATANSTTVLPSVPQTIDLVTDGSPSLYSPAVMIGEELITERVIYTDDPLTSTEYNRIIEIVGADPESFYKNDEKYIVDDVGNITIIKNLEWDTVDIDYEASQRHELLYVDTSAAAVYVSFNPKPYQGDTIRIVDYSNTFDVFPCMLMGNNYNIEHAPIIVKSVQGSTLEYTYDVEAGWVKTLGGGAATSAGISGTYAVTKSITIADDGTFNIGSVLPDNSIVTSIMVNVTAPFVSAGSPPAVPTLIVGNINNSSGITSAIYNDLTTIDLYFKVCYFNVLTAGQLLGVLDTNGAMSGNADILIEYSEV